MGFTLRASFKHTPAKAMARVPGAVPIRREKPSTVLLLKIEESKEADPKTNDRRVSNSSIKAHCADGGLACVGCVCVWSGKPESGKENAHCHVITALAGGSMCG